MDNIIGNNIKLFRDKLGLSQADIANHCGVNREVLSYYENGNREVSLLHLEKISSYMNIEMEVFLEEKSENIQSELALAFRADELTPTDRTNIAYFKSIVKNYLKMKTIEANGTQA